MDKTRRDHDSSIGQSTHWNRSRMNSHIRPWLYTTPGLRSIAQAFVNMIRTIHHFLLIELPLYQRLPPLNLRLLPSRRQQRPKAPHQRIQVPYLSNSSPTWVSLLFSYFLSSPEAMHPLSSSTEWLHPSNSISRLLGRLPVLLWCLLSPGSTGLTASQHHNWWQHL
jgi:hypothetical protein